MEFRKHFPRGENSGQPATDTRTTPLSGVAWLVVNINGHLDRCTGFLVRVDGQFVILTDANNLYDRVTGKAEEVTVFLGGNGEDHNGCVIRKQKSEFEVPEDHKTGLTELDIGVILLRRDDYFSLNMHYFTICYPTSNILRSTLHMSGYQVAEDNRVIPKTMELTPLRSDEVFLYYKCASATGNPGWPIYILREKTRLVIGIHTKGYNKVTLFSKRVMSSIENMMQELHHDHWELAKDSNLRRRQPRDRFSYQEQSPQGQHVRLSRCTSEVSINIASAKDEPTDTFQRLNMNRQTLPAKWRRDCHSQYFYHDNTGSMPNESSSRVANFQRKDVAQINIQVRLPSPPTEVSPLSHHNDEYQSFGRNSPATSEDSTEVLKFQGGRKCILLPPSNLPFHPRVIQPYDSFKSMEDGFIRKDRLNIFPSNCLADSSVQAKLVDTLSQMTSSGMVLVTSSLLQLLHISVCKDQPKNILFEMFGAIPKLSPFVLTVTDTKTQDTNVNVYTRHLNQQVLHTVRMFTDEKISSIYGTIVPEDFQTREAFQAALSSLRETSGIFCNPKLLFMDSKRSHNVSRSCLLAMAVSSNIPATIKDVEVTLGSKKNLLDHLETMTSKLKSRLVKASLEKDAKTTFSRTSSCHGSGAMRDRKPIKAVHPIQRNSSKSPEYSPESEDSPIVHTRREEHILDPAKIPSNDPFGPGSGQLSNRDRHSRDSTSRYFPQHGTSQTSGGYMSSGPATNQMSSGYLSSGPTTSRMSSGYLSYGPATNQMSSGYLSSGPATSRMSGGHMSSGSGTYQKSGGYISSGSRTYQKSGGYISSGSRTYQKSGGYISSGSTTNQMPSGYLSSENTPGSLAFTTERLEISHVAATSASATRRPPIRHRGRKEGVSEFNRRKSLKSIKKGTVADKLEMFNKRTF